MVQVALLIIVIGLVCGAIKYSSVLMFGSIGLIMIALISLIGVGLLFEKSRGAIGAVVVIGIISALILWIGEKWDKDKK